MADSIAFIKLGRKIHNSTDRLNFIKKKYNRNLNDYGRKIANRKAVEFILKPIFQNVIYYLYELNLDLARNIETHESNYTFKMLTPEDHDAIYQIETMEEWLKGSLAKRLESNCHCLAVFDGANVVGFNYAAVKEGNIPLLRLKILTGSTVAWSEQISILKEYRRCGLAGYLRRKFYQELKIRGITKLYGHRQEFNVASRQSARKFTSNIIAKVNYIKIGAFNRLKFFKVQKSLKKDSHFMVVKPNAKEQLKQKSIFSPIFVVKLEEIK